MKPSSGPRFGRQHFPVVYVTRFGKHSCGTKICSGGKSPPKKAAQEDLHSCLSDQASSATLDKTGPVGVTPQRQRKRPSLGPGMVQIRGSQNGCRQPQSKGWRISRAKPPGREASKLAPSRKKDQGSKRGRANSTISGSFEDSGADEYGFSTSEENANETIREQKKKSAVWVEVFAVISKMVEENAYFRNRLVSNFHFSDEDAAKNSQQPLTIQGTDINQNLQSEISFTETDEAIFGWV